MQQGLLLESTLAGRPWANLEQIVVDGTLPQFAAGPMRAAWLALAARHDALRMRLVPDAQGGAEGEGGGWRSWFGLDRKPEPAAEPAAAPAAATPPPSR